MPEPILPLDPLQFTRERLADRFRLLYGKGSGYAGALFETVHRGGGTDVSAHPRFRANPALARRVAEDFRLALPEVVEQLADGEVRKLRLRLADGEAVESVLLPMRRHLTLCLSSQAGCARGCLYCETGQGGLSRSLDTGEIVAQLLVARFGLGRPVGNLVFMGMGEPLDNLEAVLPAIDIFRDPRGPDIATSDICLSTCGQADGIRRLAQAAAAERGRPGARALHALRLAVSLNAPDDGLRSSLMPVNRRWPLAELKEALRAWKRVCARDSLSVEYVLLAGVNDRREHALALASWLRELDTAVHLIPCNPRGGSPFARPSGRAVADFFGWLVGAGQFTLVRAGRGERILAGCGQLGARRPAGGRPAGIRPAGGRPGGD